MSATGFYSPATRAPYLGARVRLAATEGQRIQEAQGTVVALDGQSVRVIFELFSADRWQPADTLRVFGNCDEWTPERATEEIAEAEQRMAWLAEDADRLSRTESPEGR